jgi:hypothetical protein
LDKLVLNIHYVKMPIANRGGKTAAKGRTLANMTHLKKLSLKLKLKKLSSPRLSDSDCQINY